MTGEKAVRISARFICSAADASPCRMTSVTIGSASAVSAMRPVSAV